MDAVGLVRCPNPGCESRVPYLRSYCHTCQRPTVWREYAPCRTCGERYDHVDRDACGTCRTAPSRWRLVAERLADPTSPRSLRVSREALPHPEGLGGAGVVAAPVGRPGDYRIETHCGADLYVTTEDETYVATATGSVEDCRGEQVRAATARLWPAVAVAGAWALARWLDRPRS